MEEKNASQHPAMVGFKQAFLDFWRQYLDVLGRTTRAGYWWNILWYSGVILGLYVLAIIGGMSAYVGAVNGQLRGLPLLLITVILAIAFGLATIIPVCLLAIRRYRDAGLRGRGFFSLWGISVLAQLGVKLIGRHTGLIFRGQQVQQVTQHAGLSNFLTLITVLIGLFFFVLTFLASDRVAVDPGANRVLRFFFRTQAR